MNLFKSLWAKPATYFILLTLFYALAASQAVQSFSYKWTTIVVTKEFSMDKSFNGTAPKPYAYRILIPDVINAVIDHAPRRVLDAILDRSRVSLNATVGPESTAIDDRNALAYGFTLLLAFPLLVGTLFFLRALCGKILPPNDAMSRLVADLAPILFALLLTITYRVYNGFVYDHSELFLFTAYLLLSWKEKWILSLPILVLAILNKETAILFPIFGLVIAWRDGRIPKRRIYVLLVEFVILATGYAVIHHMMRGRIGDTVEWHLPINIPFWLSLKPWLAVTSPHFQFALLPKPSNILVLFPLVYCVLGYWSRKPLVLRSLVVISSVINLPLFFLFSYLDEFRNLSLMFPFLVMAAAHTLFEFYRAGKTPAEA